MAISAQKFLPGSKGTAKPVSQAKISSITLTSSDKKNVNTIRVKTIQIDRILKGTVAADKKRLDDKKKEANRQRKEDIETGLEKKPDPKKKITMPKILPRTGILDWIKNFIGNILLGYFAVRLLKHLPALKGIFTTIVSVGEFIIDWGGKLLNAVVTFIDWGYKIYDGFRGQVGNIFGKGGLKVFDTFMGILNKVLNAVIIIALAFARIGLNPLKWFKGKKPPTTKPSPPGTKGTRTKSGGWRNPFRTKPTVSTGTGGKPKLKLPGTGPRVTGGPKGLPKGLPKGMKIPGGKGGIVGLIMLIPTLFEAGGLISQGKWKTAANILLSTAASMAAWSATFGAFGAGAAALTGVTLGFGSPAAIALLIAGFAAATAASMGAYAASSALLKKAGLHDEDITSFSKGGRVKKATRTVTPRRGAVAKKKRPPIHIDSVKIDPGEDITDKKDSGFVGWIQNIFGSVVSAFSPLKFFKDYGDKFGAVPFFGPIISLAVQALVGQKPSDKEYKNAGMGIIGLLAKGLNMGKLIGTIGGVGFAAGGLVDKSVLMKEAKAGDWLGEELKKSMTPIVDETIREIEKNLGKEEKENKGAPGASDTPGGQEGYMSGPAGTSGDKLTMARNLMRDLGLTEAQAAGIVGNMAAESGVENGRPQGSRPGVKAPLVVDGKTGYGLVQWTSQGRQQGLWNFAKSKGHDMSKPLTMDIEYQYFLKEFQGPYGPVLSQIRKAKSVKDASTIFMQQYEIPAGYRTQAKIMERYNMSQPIYEKLSAGKGTATEGIGRFVPSVRESQGPDVEQGKGTEASNRLLKDFPQIKSRGSAQEIYASGLGYFLKKSGAGRPGKGDYGDPPQSGADMEHPDHGGIRASHRGTGHKRGVALDLGGNSATSGAYQDDQKKLWPFISKFLTKYGLNNEPFIPQVLHGRGESFSPVGPGSGPDGGHNDHFHVEFHKGGEVKGVKRDTPHLGLKKGERWGKFQEGETWIDIDSGEYKPVKNMLLAINQASGRDGVLQAIRDYAPYEAIQSRTKTKIVEKMVPVAFPMPGGSSGVGGAGSGGGGVDTSILAAGK